MADSVDRVFGHALNTINKIRTSSAKPPVNDRLHLYGLYKQSMEGDVSSLFPRPSGTSDTSRKEAEKYDAWDANRGLSRTEAKKRYIEKLIETMHTYASGTPEARELVGELEFVWDQVKGNSNSDSSGDSPARKMGRYEEEQDGRERSRRRDKEGKGMRVLSPVSQPAEEEGEQEDEFVDAPVSQFGEMEAGAAEDKSAVGGDEERTRMRRVPAADVRWRRRVENAIVKMTAEVAALRELVESRRYTAQRRRASILNWLLTFGWFAIKLVVADVVLLWLTILYLRRRKDRRLEGAVRVMLGDAQAVAKNLATQMQSKLPSRK